MRSPAQAAILCACALAAACASGGETYRRPLERVASMDPLHAAAIYDSHAVSLVYEPLLEVDYEARPYRLAPCLAAKMPEVSEDGLVYTFELRPDARFQPPVSRPVAAADVKYSLERLADRSNASSGMWIMDNVASIETPDALHVRISLKKPSHVFPWLMSMAYTGTVPREAVERHGAKFGSVAAGSGPYRLAAWRRNHLMRFEKDASWRGWREMEDGGEGAFDAIEYLVIDDSSTRWLMFLAGEVDFLGDIPRDNWDAVAGPDGAIQPWLAARGARLHSAPSLTVMYVGVNMVDPVLGKNVKLRQALNCAFDFQAWNRFNNGRAMQADGPVPPGVDARPVTPFKYSFDPARAKTLMAEAGYPGGIDPATGRRLILRLGVGRASQEAREQAELLASFWARIGVNLETDFMTWDSFLRAVNEGRVQLFMLGWVGDYPDAENFLQLFLSRNFAPGANRARYANAAFDHAYDAAMGTNNPDERVKLWIEAQEIVREDCPWVFLHYQKSNTLCGPRVKGYIPGDFPYGTEKRLRVRKNPPASKSRK